MFSLVQLQCFIAVAEERHFGTAAARLRMTQPPLSRQIQQLERELGTRLFERTSRRVELTEAGRVLLPSARRLIDLSAKTAADVRSVGEGVAGRLTIAYTAMAGQSVLPELIRRASRELPRVTLLLRELVTTDQVDELEKGTVDIGLLRPLVDRPSVETTRVLEERLVIALPADSALAVEEGPVALRRLEEEPLLMYSPGGARYFHDLLLSMFVAEGIHPRVVQYAGQVPALLALVRAGMGFTLVPASAQAIVPPGVVLRAVAPGVGDGGPAPVRLDIAWNRDAQNPLVAEVLRIAADIAGRPDPDMEIDASSALPDAQEGIDRGDPGA